MVPLTGSVAYTYTAFDPVTGLVDKQQEIMASLGLKLTNNWSVRARCATTSISASASRTCCR